MKFEFDGRTRELDVSDPLLSHAVAIQEFTGLSLAAWEKSLLHDSESPGWLKSLTAAYWLMLVQGGEEVPIGSTPDFRPVSFALAMVEAWTAELKAADEGAAEPDPTKNAAGSGAAGQTPQAAGLTGS